MGKALSIKDTATYDLVAELARQTGLSMTQAVNAAVTANLQRLEQARAEAASAWLARRQAEGPMPADAWVEPDEVALPETDVHWQQ